MKKLLFILILAGLGHSVRAQQYLFPIPRLKQLYFCQTKECLSKEVRGYGYTFSRPDSKEMPQEATYTYLNRQLSPYRAEALLSLHTGGMRPSLFFSTNNQSYPAQLQKEIRESGFVESAERPDPKAKSYTLREGDLVWYLTVTETTAANKPALIVGMYSFSQPVSAQNPKPSTDPKPAPANEDSWDTKYPVGDAAALFQAERKYAADYERKNGKVGHTFSRVEKLRIQGKRLGTYRALTDHRWKEAFDLALQTTGFQPFNEKRREFYKREALFDIAGEKIWVPIQEAIVPGLEKDFEIGQELTLYTVFVSHHDYGGTLYQSFLVNAIGPAASIASKVSKASETKDAGISPAGTTQSSPNSPRQAPPTALSGGLTYTPRKVERTYHRKNARGETIASARAVFEFPEFNNAGLNAMLRRKIVKGGFYEVEAQRVVNDYKESIAEMKDDEISATMSNEYLNVRVTIEHDTPRFLLLKNDFNSYGAGAAHGEISENYWTYDKQKKTLLTLTDLFDYAGMTSLHTIAEATFRKNEKLSPTASLCQGYLFDNCRFALAGEFRLDKNALTFVYNPYEAKSFSQGIWSLSVPYSSIQKLFRPDMWSLIEQNIVGTSRASTSPAGDRTASAPPIKTSTTATLSEGATLLFKDTKSKLSIKEKDAIFFQMKFNLTKDKKKFFLSSGEDFPFDAGVFVEDLNQDSIEEILIVWGNLHTSGMTGSDVTLFIKDNSGNYQKNLGFEGAGIEILKTKNLGFPDLLIAGRGFCFPVWRWNGRSYQYHRQQCE